AAAPVYLTSVNALAETGELINIDGTPKGRPVSRRAGLFH
ncbi:LUD domain-containing protein, partial [Flavonifractor plautii]